jgi:DUF218 domain
MDRLGSHKSRGRDCSPFGRASNPPFEAAELWQRGLADKILISQPSEERAVSIGMPSHSELNREILLKLGVPGGVIETFGTANQNTRDEAVSLREWAERNAASAFIIPTEIFPARRAGFFVASFPVRLSKLWSCRSTPRTLHVGSGGKRNTEWLHFKTKF